jgi:dTDP-4-dehydrorhamnose 3,5-epimerase
VGPGRLLEAFSSQVALVAFDTEQTAIDGLVVVTTKQISDDRGAVREIFRLSTFTTLAGSTLETCSQVNLTHTTQGAIRGLHGEEMTKLVGVVAGEAFGAYVDARPGSPSFGQVVSLELRLGRQVLVPKGVLNGFQATGGEGCEYLYCFDQEWSPTMPGIGVHPLDPDLSIPWPIKIDREDRSLLSEKDAGLPRFSSLRLS